MAFKAQKNHIILIFYLGFKNKVPVFEKT